MTKSGLFIPMLLVLTSAILFSTTKNKNKEVPAVAYIFMETTTGQQNTTSLPKDSVEIPKEIISESYVGQVVFPHFEHYKDLEIECIECHHEMGAKNINIPHSDYFNDFWIDCEACHKYSETKIMVAHACSSCHNLHPVNIADEMISKKVAVHKNCWGCHDSGTGLEASESCETCHIK